MNVIYSKEGHLIKAHLEHTLKSFYYATDVSIFFKSIEESTLYHYPKEHWCQMEAAKTLLPRFELTSLQDESAKEAPHPTFTLTIDNQFVFLMAPVLFKGQIKGQLIAGPIALCRCSAPETISELSMSERFVLSNHVVVKKPPRHLFLSQLLHHLIRKSIHIGPNEAIGVPTQYLSKEDMQQHVLDTSNHEKLELIAQMVLNLQKQEALSLYKKSILLQGIAQNSDVAYDEVLLLKQQLITLETLISSQILKNSFEPQKMMQLKKQFFNQIFKMESYPCLVACGENIIKVYCETLRRKALEGLSQPVRKCILYIQEHFKEPIALEDICAFVKRSRAYLSSKFSQEMGVTLSEYIKATRIDYSKHLLAHTDASILDVALESGFESQNYFATVFRSVTGMSPANFRKNTNLSD